MKTDINSIFVLFLVSVIFMLCLYIHLVFLFLAIVCFGFLILFIYEAAIRAFRNKL
jgi:hypothetical protein